MILTSPEGTARHILSESAGYLGDSRPQPALPGRGERAARAVAGRRRQPS